MGAKPHTLEVTLTGGEVYDKLELPDRLVKLFFGSIEGNALKYKYVVSETPIDIKAEIEDYNSGWLPEIWDDVTVYINGTGTVRVEYWV